MVAGLGLVSNGNFVKAESELGSHPAISSRKMGQDYWNENFNGTENVRNQPKERRNGVGYFQTKSSIYVPHVPGHSTAAEVPV
jgi:hypothetical protein